MRNQWRWEKTQRDRIKAEWAALEFGQIALVVNPKESQTFLGQAMVPCIYKRVGHVTVECLTLGTGARCAPAFRLKEFDKTSWDGNLHIHAMPTQVGAQMEMLVIHGQIERAVALGKRWIFPDVRTS